MTNPGAMGIVSLVVIVVNCMGVPGVLSLGDKAQTPRSETFHTRKDRRSRTRTEGTRRGDWHVPYRHGSWCALRMDMHLGLPGLEEVPTAPN